MRRGSTFDTLFTDMFEMTEFTPVETVAYPVNVYEDEKGLTVEIAAIDAKREDISIETKEGVVLKLTYIKPECKGDKGRAYLIHKLTKGSFKFSWTVPVKFDLSKIKANLKDGLLKIKIPIKPEAATVKVTIG